MKCPKCGYHSFDYLDSCKKCDNDLTSFKSKFNLRSLIFPHQSAQGTTPPESETAGSEELSPAAPTAAAGSDFGFDFMDDSSTPPSPEPVGLELPEIDETAPQEPDLALPAEDDAFSWDEEPEPETTEPEAIAEPSDDFEWDEEPDLDTAPGEEEDAFEEAETDDTFGLDLSWDSDLPALDEDQIEEEAPLESMEAGDLPDWDFDEEPPPEDKKPQKPKGEEEPHNPFDSRGPREAASAPAPSESGGAIQAELPFALDSKPEAEPLTNLAATATPVAAAAASFASDAALTDIEATTESAAEEPLPADSTTTPALPSPVTRGLALAIDLLVLSGAILLFLIAGESALAPAGSQRLLPSLDALLNLAIPYFLVFFSVSFGYFTLFHFLTGQTPGKMLLRVRVETETGTPLAFSQAFLRSTGGLFSLLPFGLGFLAILFDRRRRGWNDRLAGTLVVAATSSADTLDDTVKELQ